MLVVVDCARTYRLALLNYVVYYTVLEDKPDDLFAILEQELLEIKTRTT